MGATIYELLSLDLAELMIILIVQQPIEEIYEAMVSVLEQHSEMMAIWMTVTAEAQPVLLKMDMIEWTQARLQLVYVAKYEAME